jgi:hypothetical protein
MTQPSIPATYIICESMRSTSLLDEPTTSTAIAHHSLTAKSANRQESSNQSNPSKTSETNEAAATTETAETTEVAEAAQRCFCFPLDPACHV